MQQVADRNITAEHDRIDDGSCGRSVRRDRSATKRESAGADRAARDAFDGTDCVTRKPQWALSEYHAAGKRAIAAQDQRAVAGLGQSIRSANRAGHFHVACDRQGAVTGQCDWAAQGQRGTIVNTSQSRVSVKRDRIQESVGLGVAGNDSSHDSEPSRADRTARDALGRAGVFARKPQPASGELCAAGVGACAGHGERAVTGLPQSEKAACVLDRPVEGARGIAIAHGQHAARAGRVVDGSCAAEAFERDVVPTQIERCVGGENQIARAGRTGNRIALAGHKRAVVDRRIARVRVPPAKREDAAADLF